MKMEANELNKLLTKQIKVRPWFIPAPIWIEFKKIINQFKKCLINDYLPLDEIYWIENRMVEFFKIIEESSSDMEMDEYKEYLRNMIDYYLELSVKSERFETSTNLSKLVDSMSVRILINKNQ